MSTKKNEGDFHVALNGIQLSEAARERIQEGIQRVVMNELAGYYPNPDEPEKPRRHHFDNGVITVFPRWWWGFILRPIFNEELNSLTKFRDELNAPGYGLQH